ncbi:hypothetical protein [Ruegeria sp.]|uniref:hypothetical protein n=1 Tax=Ruegeria sp. TaxID=1879320 RepID=UPI003B595375
MQSILRHVYLERRRLYAIGFLSFSAGVVLYSHINATQMGLPVPVITGLIYMVAVVVAAAATTYFLPGLRKITDAVAVTRLAFALWVVTTQSHEVAAAPFISATVVVGGAILLVNLGNLVSMAAQKTPVSEWRTWVRDSLAVYQGGHGEAAGFHAQPVKVLSQVSGRAHEA